MWQSYFFKSQIKQDARCLAHTFSDAILIVEQISMVNATGIASTTT